MQFLKFYQKLPKSLTTVTTFSKLIALFLFILLPLVGFYLGLQYSSSLNITSLNTPAPTSSPGQTDTLGWKTYTNNDYGFSFKYPNDWKIIPQDSKSTENINDSAFLEEFAVIILPINSEHDAIAFRISNLTFQDFLKIGLVKSFIENQNLTDINKDSYQGKKFYETYQSNNQKIPYIEYSAYDVKGKTYFYEDGFMDDTTKKILESLVIN